MNVVALLRVSSPGQESRGASLDAQRRRFDEWVASTGATVVAIFRGQESGAADIEDRELLGRVLACAREQSVGALWVFSQDRLTRGDERSVAGLVWELRKLGVRIIAGGTEIDLEDPSGSFIFSIHSAAARYEWALIRRRTMEGKRQIALNSRRPSGPAPYGYWNPPKEDPRRGILQVDHDEAPIMRKIFAALAGGVSLGALAEQLIAEGIPTVRGGKWTKTTLRRMAANPVYLGVVEAAVWERIGETGTFRKNVAGARAVITEGAHEPLVSQEVWEAANRMRRGPSTQRPVLLTGLLWIAGHRQVIDYSHGERYYRPAGVREGAWVPAETVHETVWQGFLGIAKRPAALAALLRQAARGSRPESDQAPALEVQARKLRSRLSELVTLVADKVIDRAAFAQQQAEAQAQLRRVEHQLAETKRRQAGTSSGHRARALAAAAALLDRGLSTTDKRRILRSLVGRVDVELAEGEAQPKAARGRFGKRAGPKWTVQEAYLHLHRDPSPETSRSDCSRSWVTVQVVAHGELLAPEEALERAMEAA